MGSYSETCFRPEGKLRSLEFLLSAAQCHNHRPNLHPDRQLVSFISAHNQRPLDSEANQWSCKHEIAPTRPRPWVLGIGKVYSQHLVGGRAKELSHSLWRSSHHVLSDSSALPCRYLQGSIPNLFHNLRLHGAGPPASVYAPTLKRFLSYPLYPLHTVAPLFEEHWNPKLDFQLFWIRRGKWHLSVPVLLYLPVLRHCNRLLSLKFSDPNDLEIRN